MLSMRASSSLVRFPLEFSVALKGHDVILDLDVNVFYVHPRKLDLYDYLVICFVYVERRAPNRACRLVHAGITRHALVENAAHPLLKKNKVLERYPPVKRQTRPPVYSSKYNKLIQPCLSSKQVSTEDLSRKGGLTPAYVFNSPPYQGGAKEVILNPLLPHPASPYKKGRRKMPSARRTTKRIHLKKAKKML